MRQVVGMIVVSLATTGCAAIFKGGKQEVRVVAIPDKSDVRVDGQFAGESPATINVDRNGSQNVVVTKDGYKEQRVAVKRHPDTAWWIWDIATCAIPVLLCIPLGVDAISGAWMSLDDEIRVKLDALPAAPQQPARRPAEPLQPYTPTPPSTAPVGEPPF